MKKLVMALPLLAVACGCTSVQVVRDYGYLNDPQLKLADVSKNPYHIDFDVAPARVTGEGASCCWFWFFSSDDGRKMSSPGMTFDSGMSSAKDSATFDAVEKAKCDALMGCLYKYTMTSSWLGMYKETKCEVKGFPANVKAIHMVEDRPVVIDKDKQIIRVKPWEKLDTSALPPPPPSGMPKLF